MKAGYKFEGPGYSSIQAPMIGVCNYHIINEVVMYRLHVHDLLYIDTSYLVAIFKIKYHVKSETETQVIQGN